MNRKALGFGEQLGEAHPVDVCEHQPHRRVGANEVVELEDVVVVELGEQLGFAGEIGGKGRARRNRRAQRLDRDVPPKRLLERVVNVGDRSRRDVLDRRDSCRNTSTMLATRRDCSLQMGATSTTLGTRA